MSRLDTTAFERLMLRSTNRRRLIGATAAGGAIIGVSLPGSATRSFLQTGTPEATPFGTPVGTPGTLGTPAAVTSFSDYPFSMGVASGDPLPDSVILWTRLAPDPLNGGGLTGDGDIELQYEIASDENFATIVQSGTTVATEDLGHSVHVDARGLSPATVYYYRFMAGGEVSPVGRTRTSPAADASPESVRFAFVSCQHYEQGFYTAYRQLASEQLDLVLHLGDYIYEGPPSEGTTAVRYHTGPEIETLLHYRNRYGLYKSDPDLQLAHASAPFATTWDDHEVDNNYTAEFSEYGIPVEELLARRANAYQAYYENLPLRPESMPVGPDMQLYRRLKYGNLVEFQILDTRQYRTDHPCGDGAQVRCPAQLDPDVTTMGPEQERWLLEGLDASSSSWNVIAQQIMMAEIDRQPGPGEVFGQDSWSGYPAARNRVLQHLMSRGTSNPVVLTGDVHSSWVNDLMADWEDQASATIGTELVVTSITSGGDPTASAREANVAAAAATISENPYVRFQDSSNRGYVSCEVTPQRWTATYQAVDGVTQPDLPVRPQASFVIESGSAGAQRVS